MKTSRAMKVPMLSVCLIALALLSAAVTYLYREVRAEAVRDESRPAQAIVVFGAAEYSGRPSPTLRSKRR